MKPLAVDLFCGVGGFTDGALLEGFDCIGFDIEQHVYGDHRYPAQLVVQDILTLHGSQFKTAAMIWASPPCQFFSYCAMPWSRAKALAAAVRADPVRLEKELALFNACFRIQREASEAAGHHIPMVVENVRGAQPWVGRARWNYGSFYLFGDVPALMPITMKGTKVPGISWSGSDKPGYVAKAFNGTAAERLGDGIKTGDAGWRERGLGRQLQDRAIKNNGGSWFNIAHNTTSGKGQNPDGRKTSGHPNIRNGHKSTGKLTDPSQWVDGAKGPPGAWEIDGVMRSGSSKSPGRKMASAMIAKIPLPLSRWVAATYFPKTAKL